MATHSTHKSTSHKSSSSKSHSTKSGKRSTTPPSKRWSSKVKTDSTHPEPGLFKKSAKAIAEGMTKKSVSPEGPGQAMRMLNFYENRAGKNLSSERKHAIEGAKKIVHEKVEQDGSHAKSTRSRSASTRSKSHSRRKSTS